MKRQPSLWPIVMKIWMFMFLLNYAVCQARDLQSDDQNVKLSFISASKSFGKNSKIWIGLRVQLSPGWKTYWRSPGVAGYSVRFDWKDLNNSKLPKIHWPLPRHFHTDFGTVNVYEGDFILPIRLEVQDVSKPVQGNVKVDLLICDKSSCVPVQQSLHLNIPPGSDEEDITQASLIKNALSQVPLKENSTAIHIENAEISSNDIPPTIRVTLTKHDGFSSQDLPEVFMELENYFLDAPRVDISSDHKVITYSSPVYTNENRIPSPLPKLVGKAVKLTIGLKEEGKIFSFEENIVIKNQSLTLGFIASMLLLAFIGGLILNIMPCVLPVLSLKVFSIVRQVGREYKHIRREFLVTAFGILFSFLVLAIGELLLKATGNALGWGVQFQEPIFIIALICILTIFAANLFGFFEFRLPSFIASLGGMKPHNEGLVGSFLEGSLVTILATPCTAPFLGTALAFSLSRGPIEIVLVFMTMGLGLSSPFLLMALFPSLAARLPKPGIWMNRIKGLLGSLLILTVLWLLFVLKGEIGIIGATSVATFMGLILTVISYAYFKSKSVNKISWVLVILLVTISFTLLKFLPTNSVSHVQEGQLWQPFKPTLIQEYVKSNKVVFVNITADWCLTCQINKYIALKNKEVIEELSKHDVVAMEGDWTNHNLNITTYLETFNQYGIPFYAVYGCRNRTGIFLGQLLTPRIVIDAIRTERCPTQ